MKPKQSSLQRTTANAEASYRSAFAQRLKHAAEKHEIADLAATIAVTPATLYRWLNAKFDPSLPKLAKFAQATNINLAWLVTGRGPIDARQALRHALLEEYQATDFEPVGAQAAKAPLAFHEPWLFELLYGPAAEPKLFGPTAMNPPLLMEAGEDSMEPTIAKGDLLLIDCSFGLTPTELRQAQGEGRSPFDGIYAFRPRALGANADHSTSHLLVRRVQYRVDGAIAVRCDNPKYPEEIYQPNAQNPPTPWGRVVWRGGRI
jgi:phage repressor protein C with HTH and peptisase S24 domain